MITEDTVFIIGAGGSVPYGFPTGKGLRKYIVQNLHQEMNSYFKQRVRKEFLDNNIMIYKKFEKVFFNSGTESIDLFLSRRQEYQDIGKLSIILSILKKEQESKFNEYCSMPDQDWYSYLYQRMSNTLIAPDSYKSFKDNKVTFITFNYDRSFENYLYICFTNSFKLTPTEKNNEIKDLFPFEFVHIYGNLAPLKWQNEEKHLLYGYPDFLELEPLMSNVRIIHEKDRSEVVIKEKIKVAFQRAKKIFFLGFSYAKENMEILEINSLLPDFKKINIYGTALGMTEREIFIAKKYFSKKIDREFKSFMNPPRIENVDCLTLLKKYL